MLDTQILVTGLQDEEIELLPPSKRWLEPLWQAVEESRSELGEFLDWVPLMRDPAQLAQNMSRAEQNFAEQKEELRYLIISKSSQEFLGLIGLHIRDMQVPYYEMGYWLRTSATGLGVMTRAVSLLSEFALQRLKANRLEIRTAASNRRSADVALRCGYKLEARLSQHRRLPNGQLDDTLIFIKSVGQS